MSDLPPVVEPAAQTDSFVVRAVVVGLIVVVLGALGAVTWLISTGTDAALVGVPAGMGTTALGALAAVLVSTRSRA